MSSFMEGRMAALQKFIQQVSTNGELYRKDEFAEFIQYEQEVYSRKAQLYRESHRGELESKEDPVELVSYLSFKMVKYRETNALEGTSSHVEYLMEVTAGPTISWKVEHRYSELLELHEVLTAISKEPLPEFPRKKWLGAMKKSFIEDRFLELSKWADEVSKMKNLTSHPIFQTFCDPSGYELKAWKSERERILAEVKQKVKDRIRSESATK